MLKKILLPLLISLSFSSFLQAETLSYQALTKLMNENPTCETFEGEMQSVNSLIAPMMLSKFDNNGLGWLSVSENNCDVESGKMVCRLFILNSERILDPQTNSYLPTTEMLESALIIDYMLDIESLDLLNTECFFAG